MDSFAGMEAFARVVEYGSFTKAATRLQTAKSSVSDAIRGLEERLGVRLLERTTRRVRPTEAGERLYARCRRLLDEAQDARAEARAAQAAPSGRLRVAVPDGFGERYLVPDLGAFLARFPAVAVDLVSGTAHTRLVEDAFDLAIRVTEAPDPGLVVRRIGTSGVIIVASPAYLAARGVPETPRDVARHTCVAIAPPVPWNERWRIGEETVSVRPAVVLNTGEALRAAALNGLGLVALPDWIVPDVLATGQLVRLFPTHAAPASGIYSVYPTHRLLAPLVRLFVDHVVAGLRARGIPP